MASITVIVPSIGRDTLQAALDSCAAADEVIVVHDLAGGDVGFVPDRVRFFTVDAGDRGYTARTRGIAKATGTHIAFLDDDDVFTPGAVNLMRERACDRPVIFRMDDPTHGLLWRDRELRYANVGTPMLLVPNQPERLGVWAPHEGDRGGDFTFISGCVERMGCPVWRPEVVATVRPHERSPRVSVAVVTPWMGCEHLLRDYELAMGFGRPDELFVIDNGDAPDVLGATILRPGRNLGFSAGSNLGLHAATADVVVFLNNDIAMTSPDWLDALVASVDDGVLAGAQLRFDMHGSVDGQPLPYLDGWCVAGMRDDLLELGGWDESLEEPSYFGDNLLSLEARAAGFVLREARVGLRHKLNGTADPNDPRVVRATALNRKRFVDRASELLTMQVAA